MAVNRYTVVGLIADGPIDEVSQRVATHIEAATPEEAEERAVAQYLDEEAVSLIVAGVFAGHLLAVDA